MRSVVLSSILFVALQCLSGSALALEGRIEADGPDLVLKLDDGRILRREALVGLRLMLATRDGRAEVRIDSVDMDAAAIGSPIPLYALTLVGPDVTPGNFCQPDPHGRRAGFPIPDGAGGFSFTCTSGAEGKCALMGYRPWDTRDGIPLRDLHRACIHMLRADYGGDDRPSTRNGTLVDISDRFGIQKPEMSAGLEFEAAWGPDGAVCVAHPRIAANLSLEDLAARYPGLSGRLGPETCTEEAMRADPRALLFNRSAVTSPSH
jgi:ADYC domain